MNLTRNKQTLLIAASMAVSTVVMSLGLSGFGQAFSMGLKTPDEYSAYQRFLNRWAEHPQLAKFLTLYLVICVGVALIGALGLLLSTFSFVVSLFTKTKSQS